MDAEMAEMSAAAELDAAAREVAEACVRLAGDGIEPGSCKLTEVVLGSDGDNEIALDKAFERYRAARAKFDRVKGGESG